MFLSKYTTMSATATDEQIREIKRLFRKSMNGVVAASMREKGMAYRVNFGLTLPLKYWQNGYGKSTSENRKCWPHGFIRPKKWICPRQKGGSMKRLIPKLLMYVA